MRPSRLIVENFGAYRARQEVDFTRLAPVFLVCGKTGSGKTTLFDAMTYALYGSVSGVRGGLEHQLWSQHAKSGEAPLVQLDFSLNQEEYRAIRVPPYRRPAKKGKASEISVEAQASLFRRAKDGGWEALAQGKSEVDRLVAERIGLTCEEFSKIILLPQGEFQRFLDMNSKDRVGVLEKLFPVDLHGRVADLAHEKSRLAQEETRLIDAELARFGDSQAWEERKREAGALEISLAQLGEDWKATDQRLKSAQLQLSLAKEAEERKAREEEARRQLAQLEARAAEAESRERRIDAARRASGVMPVIEAQRRLQAEFETVSARHSEYTSKLVRLQEKDAYFEALDASLARLQKETALVEQELGRLSSLQASWKQCEETESKYRASMRKAESLEAETGVQLGREAETEADLARLRGEAEKESQLRQDFEGARKEAETAASVSGAASVVYERLQSREKAQTESLRADEAFQRASLRFEEAQSFRQQCETADLAARLRKDLIEGQPCPVCGSTSHSLQSLDIQAESGGNATRLEAATQALKQRTQERDEAGQAAARSLSRLESAKQLVQESLDQLKSRGVLELPAEAESHAQAFYAFALSSEEKSREAAERLNVSERNLKQAEEVRHSLTRKSLELEDIRKQRGKVEEAYRQARLEEAGYAASLETLKTSLSAAGLAADPGQLIADAERHRTGLLRERQNLEDQRRQYRDERHEAEIRIKATGDQLGELQDRLEQSGQAEEAALGEGLFSDREAAEAAHIPASQLKSLETEASDYKRGLAMARTRVETLAAENQGRSPEGGSGTKLIESLEASVQEAENERGRIQSELDSQQLRRRELEASIAETERLRQKRQQLGRDMTRLVSLSALLNGEIKDRRLPFKNYALAAYFSVVVRRASNHLALMTDGRYSLAAEEGSGRGYLGLDLEARDSFTGQSRPVGALSGGERFMTSLSLALGLADTIRERSGGASLDAIFIDEGFGSLDDEALDRAIAVLDIARGSRTIGIVSHVAELRSRIPSRIEVSKGRSGSTVRLAGAS